MAIKKLRILTIFMRCRIIDPQGCVKIFWVIHTYPTFRGYLCPKTKAKLAAFSAAISRITRQDPLNFFQNKFVYFWAETVKRKKNYGGIRLYFCGQRNKETARFTPLSNADARRKRSSKGIILFSRIKSEKIFWHAARAKHRQSFWNKGGHNRFINDRFCLSWRVNCE